MGGNSPTNFCYNFRTTLWPLESTWSLRRNDIFSPLIFSHELYIYNNTLDMYDNFAPQLQGRYLSSNVNITVPGENGGTVSVPVGSELLATVICDDF